MILHITIEFHGNLILPNEADMKMSATSRNSSRRIPGRAVQSILEEGLLGEFGDPGTLCAV